MIATVILGGLFQVVLGALGVARLMRFVPRSVMVGFVNALAILICMAQVPELTAVPIVVHPLVAFGLVVMVLLRGSPRWCPPRWCPSRSSPPSPRAPVWPCPPWGTRAACRPRSRSPACPTCPSRSARSPSSPRTRSPSPDVPFTLGTRGKKVTVVVLNKPSAELHKRPGSSPAAADGSGKPGEGQN
ncbi:SulP family inorganic anion transporter [Microbispora sp. ZYX-F-249]|uniref:SulP family inorganic anion transporter n=1 Tax=Microbispora maris TaxID=3144104 RepID=A0ABV0AML9_9ACTN